MITELFERRNPEHTGTDAIGHRIWSCGLVGASTVAHVGNSSQKLKGYHYCELRFHSYCSHTGTDAVTGCSWSFALIIISPIASGESS